jgi:hypothetical protein
MGQPLVRPLIRPLAKQGAAVAAAPEWDVDIWLNAPAPISLAALRGRPVVALAFQMLCPGCVQHALPQLLRVRAAFAQSALAVVGLHTVFEHHAAMAEVSLRAFVHEYRITVPVGIDRATAGAMPATMRRYAMQGTPTLLLIDRDGGLRGQHFGHADDIALGAAIASLVE